MKEKNALWAKLSQWTVPIVLALCAALLLAAFHAIDKADSTAASAAGERGFILIDPGHGGADGGATGVNGTQEKDVNLAISLPLADFLRVLGFEVRLTRETDCSIHDASAGSLREQKVSDMRNRLQMYNNAELVLSIHQNQFGQSQYAGTQVFYSPNDARSSVLGEAIRASVVSLLQPENKREMKKGESTIYLLSNSKVPTVLVECGFLSNPEECGKLSSPEYQKKMMFAIAAGLLQYRC